ncbi:type VI secretion system contractile sheath large subunit [Roseibium aggregatum]|uniref:Type VI secretion system contractile sheath large subunit n=1 Tax=Roseibium aggregatum TaxID=187304 RepID=A0A939J2Q5_9HYPH|nr:type VI secretion system contractile sheath large subunit [Roseibium aggregatum]MBN9673436.1 type VI secretion system contractile sheath large subunit [Roseibium aggregatum]
MEFVSQEGLDRILETASDQISVFATTRPELMKGTADEMLGALIGELDARLSAQVNEILHHPSFQSLESAWRGLDYLLSNVEWDAGLKLRVMNISRGDLRSALLHAPEETSTRSPLSEALFEGVYRSPDGVPYGLLVLDHSVGDCEEDANILSEFARICAKAQTPLLTGLSPGTCSSDGFAEARKAKGEPEPPVLGQPAWAELRRNEISRYIGLCLPRMLGRRPYSDKVSPTAGFAFEEEASVGSASDFLWINAAFAMAANIGRAVKTYGWGVRIRGFDSGGEVIGLPEVPMPSAGETAGVMPPVEIVIGERREAQLAEAGTMPLLYRKASAKPVFFSAQSLNMPCADDDLDPEAKTEGRVLSRLPYLLCATRYAHPVMRMAADWRAPRDEAFEAHVQAWLDSMVCSQPWAVEPARRASSPLQDATFTLSEGSSGRRAELVILPGYQLEGIGVPIRLQLTLPERTGAGSE